MSTGIKHISSETPTPSLVMADEDEEEKEEDAINKKEKDVKVDPMQGVPGEKALRCVARIFICLYHHLVKPKRVSSLFVATHLPVDGEILAADGKLSGNKTWKATLGRV